MLLETVMDNMMGRQKDACTLVRMLALRGLGNIAAGSPEKVRASSASWPRWGHKGAGGHREMPLAQDKVGL